MNRRQIDKFFKILDAEFGRYAKVILTGAAAGAIYGSRRPSLDIDFAIELKDPTRVAWIELESAIKKTIEKTGIQANYAEDIDRWGMITLLDYRNNIKLYKKYGKITLFLLDPAYWSIGKMTRFIDPDIDDMIQVFRKTKTSPAYLAKVWGRALRESPRSTVLIRFRRHVESFLESYGKRIWGSSFDPIKIIQQFHKEAEIQE